MPNSTLTLLTSLGYFTGIDNVTDPLRFLPIPVKLNNDYKSAYSLVEAVNVDIDNTYALSSRDGSTLKLSGSDVHSGWARDLSAFFVEGTSLYLLNQDYSITELLAGLTLGARMSYCQVNDRVYMTNGSYIGYYSNLSMNSLAAPTATYKVPLPAGRFIAYLKGVLFVAKGKVLYISDALCDHYDVRTGYRVFENDITMLRPVDDGIYVADGRTWFLVEKRAFADDPAEFKKEPVLDNDAIPYTDININGKDLAEGVDGNFAMWCSQDGICIGDNKGMVTIKNNDTYHLTHRAIGAAAVRNSNGITHYLTVLE
jgi:hypothetical protein